MRIDLHTHSNFSDGTLTPAELMEMEGEIIGLLNRWATREVPDDGQRRDPVFVFAFGVPGRP